MRRSLGLLAAFCVAASALTGGCAATDLHAAEVEGERPGASVPEQLAGANLAVLRRICLFSVTAEPEAVFASAELDEIVRGRIVGNSWSERSPVSLDELRYLTVTYLDFDGEIRTGELIAHRALAQELVEIFAELYEARFPIAGVELIESHGLDDEVSMAANNSYCFCTRPIAGTDRYSLHSYGMAIDLNPVQNPYVVGGSVYPAAAAEYLDRGEVRPGMIVPGDTAYNAFVSRGWSWGGHWPSPDYQHFEKIVTE